MLDSTQLQGLGKAVDPAGLVQALASSTPGSMGSWRNQGRLCPPCFGHAGLLLKACTEAWLRAQLLFLVLPSAALLTRMGWREDSSGGDGVGLPLALGPGVTKES